MTKDFDTWNSVKQKLDAEQQPPAFDEGQIWWCSVGVNFCNYSNDKISLQYMSFMYYNRDRKEGL